MRIAVISTMSGSPWGGSELLWAAMVQEALAAGHDVAVSIFRWTDDPVRVVELCNKGAHVFRRPLSRSRISKLFVGILGRLGFTYAPVERYRPDVICVSQGGTYDSLILKDLLRFISSRQTPYVVVCQSNVEWYFPTTRIRIASKSFFSRASRVVFVSEGNRQTAERQIAQAIPNSAVLCNPTNLNDSSVVPWPNLSVPCFAHVARLKVADKGQDLLFEVLSSKVWLEREWKLRLYGEGSDRAYLESLAVHFGLTERVEFRGHVPDVRAIWGENHLLVLPSRAEGTPLSLVEAMLCGRPPIVSDVGGNREWVTERETGFVAEAPSVNSFGAALERAWQSRAAWQGMGMRAHDVALSKFDPSPGRSLLQIVLEAAHLPR